MVNVKELLQELQDRKRVTAAKMYALSDNAREFLDGALELYLEDPRTYSHTALAKFLREKFEEHSKDSVDNLSRRIGRYYARERDSNALD